MSDQGDLFGPAPTPTIEWRKRHLGGRYALWILVYKGLETNEAISPRGYEDDAARPWTSSMFTSPDASARSFATREEAQAEAERLFLNPPDWVFSPDEWHARETERLRRQSGDDEDLPFIEAHAPEPVQFVAAPASDPPARAAGSAEDRRCAFYRSTAQEGRRAGQFPLRPTLLVGPRRVRRFQDNCRGAAEFEATLRSGWRPLSQVRSRWRNLPAAEPPVPYIGRGGRQTQCLEPWYLEFLRGQARARPETRRLY